jgi:hypothetical protein
MTSPYKPTPGDDAQARLFKQAIEEQAEHLGMDPVDDEEHLWIAEEALSAPLPTEWQQDETEEGEVYYFREETGESRWTHPLDDHYRDMYQEAKQNAGQKSLGPGGWEAFPDGNGPLDDNSAPIGTGAEDGESLKQRAISEHAVYLGMDPVVDVEHLWIAEEALSAPLPPEWQQDETDEGEVYYFREETGESSWTHPLDDHYRDMYQEAKQNTVGVIRAKLVAFYEERDPSKLAHIDMIMGRYDGREHEILAIIAKSSATSGASAGATDSPYSKAAEESGRRIHKIRQSLIDFYEERDPAKVAKVNDIMKRYEGREDEVLLIIEQAKGATGAAVPLTPMRAAEEQAERSKSARNFFKEKDEAQKQSKKGTKGTKGRIQSEAEEQAGKEAKEQSKKEAEDQARNETAEQARKQAEEQAKKETEEQARKQAKAQARREVEELAKKEAEEQAKKDAEEQVGKQAEEQAKEAEEEQARKEAEEQAKKEAEEEQARKDVEEEQAKREAEEQAGKEAEEQARKDVEEEEQAKKEAEVQARKEVEEEQATKEAEEQARKEAEEQA